MRIDFFYSKFQERDVVCITFGECFFNCSKMMKLQISQCFFNSSKMMKYQFSQWIKEAFDNASVDFALDTLILLLKIH